MEDRNAGNQNRIVIYESKTGFTERYARWIAERLHCEARRLRMVSEQEVKRYDTVIFGGWIMGNHIMGLDQVLEWKHPSVIAFGVGASPAARETAALIRQQNPLGDIPFFYFQGGIAYEKLGFFTRHMLKFMGKRLMQKQGKTEQEAKMAECLAASFDGTDRAAVTELVALAETQGKAGGRHE